MHQRRSHQAIRLARQVSCSKMHRTRQHMATAWCVRQSPSIARCSSSHWRGDTRPAVVQVMWPR
eukprot:6230000-Lingulodinium_polyedra.AAC.1